MFKWPKYAYIGLQANIALVISLAQEGGPPALLDPPLQRLAGIVIGIAASFLVANVLWRTDVWTILNRYLDKLYSSMKYNLNQILMDSSNHVRLYDLANLFWLTRGLIESLSDEALNTAKKDRLAELTERFESLVQIQATLSHLLITVDREKALLTANYFNFDLSEYMSQLIVLYTRHDKTGGRALSQKLQERLPEIKIIPIYSQVGYHDLQNFIAFINALIQLGIRVQ
jgi:uncharacterized membrane protein YgaE (UPF0421/DUF939 family)